jgi:hypothetical protein
MREMCALVRASFACEVVIQQLHVRSIDQVQQAGRRAGGQSAV